jgi:hypothetical protein
MTREKEIQKLIDEETGIDNYGSSDYQVGVCDGVRLADKTMIEKACNWLEEMNKMCMYELEMILGGNFINDFKKAMEE